MAEEIVAAEIVEDAHVATETEAASGPFVLRWHELVSVTNWEKGRIIGEWRAALVAAGAGASEYADEAWARHVGNVTGQHVGRLRRTYERFGAVQGDYPGLYWSHFQAALDWDDAEMWLEGAVQNRWSVSQMRTVRWETLGGPAAEKPREEDVVVVGALDEDAGEAAGEASMDWDENGEVIPPPRAAGAASENGRAAAGDVEQDDEALDGEAPDGEVDERGGATAAPRVRPFEHLPPLPDDVAEAFEGFKLVILTHKLSGWTEISRDDLVASLEALKALALQPAEGQ